MYIGDEADLDERPSLRNDLKLPVSIRSKETYDMTEWMKNAPDWEQYTGDVSHLIQSNSLIRLLCFLTKTPLFWKIRQSQTSAFFAREIR